MNEITREQWAATVESVLAEHPDFAAVTVQAIQAGILAAIDREKERAVVLSDGLHQALTTRLEYKRRDHDRIIEAVEASVFRGSTWARKTIEKERTAP